MDRCRRPEVVTPRVARVTAALAAAAAGLVVLHGLSLWARRQAAAGSLAHALAAKFDLDAEHAVPAFFATLLLLGASGLLAAIAAGEIVGRARLAWGGLAMTFFLLALDEAAGFHETLIGPLHRALRTTGVFYFAWVIPALAAVATFGVVYLRFWLRLEPPTRRLFALAATLYVGGALGGEMLGGWTLVHAGRKSLAYSLSIIFEESLELAGAVTFVHALLARLARRPVMVSFGGL